MNVGRIDESAFAENEDTVLFALGYLYESRSNPDYKKLTLNLRSILFVQRGCNGNRNFESENHYFGA